MKVDYNQIAKMAAAILAEESDGARRERETHELQQQFDTPAWGGDNRKPKPGQQDTKIIRELDEMETKTLRAMTAIFDDGSPFGAVMDAAHDQSGAMENDHNILQVSKAIASGKAEAREWFSRLAIAMETYLDAKRAMREADPDGIRYNGFKPKSTRIFAATRLKMKGRELVTSASHSEVVSAAGCRSEFTHRKAPTRHFRTAMPPAA